MVVHNPFGSPPHRPYDKKKKPLPSMGGKSCRVKAAPTFLAEPKVEQPRQEIAPASPTSVAKTNTNVPTPRHTFQVTSEDISRGEHTVAILWILREIPQASKLEIKFFTGDCKEMSIECAWETGDGVMRGVDLEVSSSQLVPVGAMLLTMITESAKNIRHLAIYSGLERVSEFTLGKVLEAFSVAGHWTNSLQTLEVSWSCIEDGTFSRLSSLPENLRSIKLDGCQVMKDGEINDFVAGLTKLESFQVVGSQEEDNRNISMIHI